MAFVHEPVLLAEVLQWMNVRENGVYADGTLGGGGHAAATARLEQYPGFHAIHGNFHDVKALLSQAGAPPLDGALLDLGVSSPQLDQAERGFSYHEDAPLDMRMDRSQGMTAADLLAEVSEGELTRILREYGEEKWAARIAHFVVERRQTQPLRTTQDLVRVVDAAIPKAVRRKDDGHPARRTFQAVRIAVNDELDPLDRALEDFVDCLKPGGRLLVITFHSLEDRLTKRCFQRLQNPCVCPPKAPVCTCGRKPKVRILARGAVPPTAEEIARNPRARSAKLRVAEKL